MQRIVSVVGGVLVLGLVTPVQAQVFDHLQCHKIKDSLAKAKYALDLAPRDPAFPVQPGCSMRTPAQLLCTEVQKTNVTPLPPGAPAAAPAQRYLCYKLKCSKAQLRTAVADQFGAREVQVKTSSFLCAPVPAPSATTTSTTSTTTTSLVSATTTTSIPPASGCPVVNELMTGGTASAAEEFVEVFNPCSRAVDLSGAKLVYRSAAGTSDITLFTWPSGTSIAAGAHLVYGSATFTGPKDGELGAGLSGTGGGVAVRDALGALLDSVGYGTATNAFVETAPAPAPAAGSSIGRLPDGIDSDDNAADWMPSATITPGGANTGS